MSTTRHNWMRTCATLATLLILLTATSAADYVRAAAPAPDDGTAAPASACTRPSPWETAPAPNVLRSDAAAAVAGGYVFFLGGSKLNEGNGDWVESAPIGADGALGVWSMTTLLVGASLNFGAVGVNGYVYTIGGWTLLPYPPFGGGRATDSVYRAAVQADGQLGAWEAQAPLGLQYGRIGLAAAATSTQIYALGGWDLNHDDLSRDVQHAAINPDGTLGPWAYTSPMLIGRTGFGAAIAGGFIYVLGGSEFNNPGSSRSVERAEINADGSLGAWQEMPPLSRPRTGVSALVAGGYLYAVSGANGDNQQSTNTVERAQIHADGSLGPWEYVDALSTGRAGYAGASADGRFYIIGGDYYEPGQGTQAADVEQVTASDLAVVQDNGLTINNGALFTNQTAVSLTISGQPGTVAMQISNDGGFAGAEWQDCVASLPWTISPYGNSTIPRVVYAKFKDVDQGVSGTYADDIILDMTPPTGTVQMTPLAQTASRPAATDALTRTLYLPLVTRVGCPPAGCAPNVTLHLSASDDTSGVGAMQIGADPAFSGGQWEPYAASKAWHLPDGLTTVYARFRDNAGNVSSVVTSSIGP